MTLEEFELALLNRVRSFVSDYKYGLDNTDYYKDGLSLDEWLEQWEAWSE